ncbi:MAG TPA: CPBP family intramembrane glutamic endopeptidase [Bryobacteraceae bacterium]|nr:CPBP family intramembrane glutamic endopeptidase [Bryobacteraceae bacterium]
MSADAPDSTPPDARRSENARRGISADTIRVMVRVVLFAFAGWSVWRLMPFVMPPAAGGLVVAALSTFAAGALANGLLARMYERSQLSAFGMAWGKPSARELLIGIAGGAGAAAAIFLVALATRQAVVERVPAPNTWPVDLVFILIVLAFGAAGEEMLFRGYAFQLLVRTMGEFAAVLPVAALFGLAHMGNQDVTALAIVNTIAWGVLLGYAFLLTRSLWLSIGLHFGWNGAMPLLGVNLSGFTMGVPGYSLRWSAGDLWSGGRYGLEGSVMTSAVVVILFFVLRRAVARPDLRRDVEADEPGM